MTLIKFINKHLSRFNVKIVPADAVILESGYKAVPVGAATAEPGYHVHRNPRRKKDGEAQEEPKRGAVTLMKGIII
jgi:hypothetical protein